MARPRSHVSKSSHRLRLALVAAWSLVVLAGARGPALSTLSQATAPPAAPASAPLAQATSAATSLSPGFAAAPQPPNQAGDSPLTPIEQVTPQQRPGALVSRELVATRRVAPGAAPVRDVALSADGRVLAFTSSADELTADNLLAGEANGYGANGYEDVYVIDLASGARQLASIAPEGAAGNSWSSGAALSADGRYVAYYSWASNLSLGDANAVQDVFVFDRQSGVNERVSVASGGGQANGRSGDGRLGARPAISADGRVVAFHSQASNLVAGDSNGVADVFVRDRLTGETARVSLSTQGAQGSDDSTRPALSADGRVVAFQSRAKNLDLAHPNPDGVSQIYVHDRDMGRTDLISLGADGLAGNGDAVDAALSADGRWVVFSAQATNLIANDANGANGAAHIFVYDRQSGALERVSVSSAGIPANRDAATPAISADGRFVAYASAASNLVDGDGNGMADIFVFDRATRHTGRASVAVTAPWTAAEANSDSQGPPALSADGRFVAFVSSASNLAAADDGAEDTNAAADVFLHERTDLPAYVLAGRIVDTAKRPVEGVLITAGPHRAVSGPDGKYRLEPVTGGTYTLAAQSGSYSFTPARRTVSVVKDVADVDFVARAESGPSLPFLALPLGGQASPAVMWQTLRDTDDGGLVDAWFDHDAPDYAKNDAVLLWDGRQRRGGLYNDVLGCYERRCYDGHDGIDFPYRDPNPATPNVFEPVAIHPAAAGKVAATVSNCAAGDRWCNGGYGNEVIVDHGNGYFTRYAHLAYLGAQPGAQPPRIGAQVEVADTLGVMGSTGNSFGTHLHFAVHRDDGNGRWDGDMRGSAGGPVRLVRRAARPLGADAGAASPWLWLHHPNVEAFLFGSQGATLRDLTGAIRVDIPANALDGTLRLELAPGAPAGPADGAQRSLGRAFALRVLDWYTSDSVVDAVSAVARARVRLQPRRGGVGLARHAEYRLRRHGHAPSGHGAGHVAALGWRIAEVAAAAHCDRPCHATCAGGIQPVGQLRLASPAALPGG